jgi:hypothetical protein
VVVALVLKKILFSELEDYPIIKSMILKKKKYNNITDRYYKNKYVIYN